MRKDFVKMKVVVQLIGKQNSKVNCFITKLLCKKKFIYLANMSVYTKLDNKDFGTLF